MGGDTHGRGLFYPTTVVIRGGSNVTGMFGPILSKSTGMVGNTSSITTKVTSNSLFTSLLNEEGLPQSPLVSHTAPLPPHQSNVDVAATFRVSFSMRKVVIDALGAMWDLIKAKSASRPGFEYDGTRNESTVSLLCIRRLLWKRCKYTVLMMLLLYLVCPLILLRILMNLLKILKWVNVTCS
nr:hypothetical protein [Tanacetum cinerariifolium]